MRSQVHNSVSRDFNDHVFAIEEYRVLLYLFYPNNRNFFLCKWHIKNQSGGFGPVCCAYYGHRRIWEWILDGSFQVPWTVWRKVFSRADPAQLVWNSSAAPSVHDTAPPPHFSLLWGVLEYTASISFRNTYSLTNYIATLQTEWWNAKQSQLVEDPKEDFKSSFWLIMPLVNWGLNRREENLSKD